MRSSSGPTTARAMSRSPANNGRSSRVVRTARAIALVRVTAEERLAGGLDAVPLLHSVSVLSRIVSGDLETGREVRDRLEELAVARGEVFRARKGWLRCR